MSPESTIGGREYWRVLQLCGFSAPRINCPKMETQLAASSICIDRQMSGHCGVHQFDLHSSLHHLRPSRGRCVRSCPGCCWLAAFLDAFPFVPLSIAANRKRQISFFVSKESETVHCFYACATVFCSSVCLSRRCRQLDQSIAGADGAADSVKDLYFKQIELRQI